MKAIYEEVEKIVEEQNLTRKYKMDTFRNSIRGRLNTNERGSKDPHNEKLFVRWRGNCYSLTRKGGNYYEEIPEKFVKETIEDFLLCEGWGKNLRPNSLRAHGVDIKVERDGSYFYIECKKQSAKRHLNEAKFIESLGQIVTRMEDGCEAQNYYGLGLPEASAKLALRRLPWRVSKRLSLDVFSVTPIGDVTRYCWQDLKKEQVSKNGSVKA